MIGTPHCFIYNRNAFQIQDKLVGVGEVNTARLCRSTSAGLLQLLDQVDSCRLCVATNDGHVGILETSAFFEGIAHEHTLTSSFRPNKPSKIRVEQPDFLTKIGLNRLN